MKNSAKKLTGIALILASMLFSGTFLTASAKNSINPFTGKTFKDNEGQNLEYVFKDASTLQFLVNGEKNAECTYKIEKNSTETSGTITLEYKKASIKWIIDEPDPEKKDNLLTKKEILAITETDYFFTSLLYSALGVPKEYQDKIDFKSDNWQNEIFNIICFMQIQHLSEEPNDSKYSRENKYAPKLQVLLGKTDEEMKNAEQNLKSMLDLKYAETKNSSINFVRHMIDNQLESPITYEYTFDGEKITLKESTKLTPVKMAFFTCQSNYEDELLFANGIFIKADGVKRTNYLPKKAPKKDSGKMTFVSSENPKDKIDIKYSINRGETISFDIEVLSGDLKGKKTTIKEAQLDQIEIFLEK